MKIPFPKNFKPQTPLKIYDYQDITIILWAKSLKPSQCDWNNLYQEGIIPPDWRLKPPVINKPFSFQVSFQEGLGISVEIGKVSFSYKSKVNGFPLENVILKFIDTYISDNIIKLQIVFRRLITLPIAKNAGLNFIKKNILKLEDNQIKVSNIMPSKIQLNFIYQYQDIPLLISLIDTPVRKNNKIYSGLLFRGIINYDHQVKNNKISDVYPRNIITKNSQFLDFFNQIINQDFL